MMSRPQNHIFKTPNPQNSPLGPQKPKTNPKIWSKLKVRIKGSIENKSCSAIQSDPKNVFEPNPTSKLAHWGPKKPKRAPKLGQNQTYELKGA